VTPKVHGQVRESPVRSVTLTAGSIGYSPFLVSPPRRPIWRCWTTRLTRSIPTATVPKRTSAIA